MGAGAGGVPASESLDCDWLLVPIVGVDPCWYVGIVWLGLRPQRELCALLTVGDKIFMRAVILVYFFENQ